jgi:phosphoglucosamine mutase
LKDVVQVLTVDGLGITMKEGWILVRPSGTEPVIRITCEGPTQASVERVLKNAKQTVEKTIESI